MKKKLLSLLLAICMMLTLVPAVFAEGEQTITADTTWDTAQTLAGDLVVESGATLTISANVTVSGTVVITGSGTIQRGSGYTGQLFTVVSGAELTLADITIDGGSGSGLEAVKAMLQISDGGRLVMTTGAVLQNNNNTYGHGATFGGAVYVAEGGAFEMRGGTIQNNAAKVGGGVDCYGTMTMTGGKISGNTASNGPGGGVCSRKNVFTASDAEISNNTSNNAGGGIQSNPGVSLTNCTISGNTASLGGGIYVQDANKTADGSQINANLTNCTISNNTATGKYGGGIWCNSNLNVEGGMISGNKSTNQGGGIYGNGFFTINGTITGNESRAGGGVYIYQQAGKFGGQCIIKSDAVISNNIANGSMGGGIVAWNDDNSLTELTIEEGAQIIDNTAASTVGGVYVNGKLDMNGGTITGNKVGDELVDIKNLASSNDNISITGGTFSSDVSEYLGDEFRYDPASGAVTEKSDATFPAFIPGILGAGHTMVDTYFVDVRPMDYYFDAVNWAYEHGITGGTGKLTFSPDAACTRAQAVTFLWCAMGSPAATGSNPFTDVDRNAYYYDAALWAVENGITNGTSASTFSPDAPCTRAQIVTLLYRAVGTKSTADAGFTDVSATAYYADAVNWACAQKITDGTGANRFSPASTCTRAQIVTFLYRCFA